MREIYSCRKCPGMFRIHQLKDELASKIGVGLCRTCDNKIQKIRAINKRMKGNEENYLYCEACERNQHRNFSSGNKSVPIEVCKFCDSDRLIEAKDRL